MHMRSDERFAVAAGVVQQKEVRRVQGGDVENEGKGGVKRRMRGSEEGM